MRNTACLTRGIIAQWIDRLFQDFQGDPRNRKNARAVVFCILLTCRVHLKAWSQTLGGCIKTHENRFSYFLSHSDFQETVFWDFSSSCLLSQIGSRGLYLYEGRALVIIDPTHYEKPRSRRQKRPMEYLGEVLKNNSKSDEIVPGYSDMITVTLTRTKLPLGLTRQLYSETHPQFKSQNALEESAISEACQKLQQTCKRSALVIGDREFKRKKLLYRLTENHTDFLIRLQGNVHGFFQGRKRDLAGLAADQIPMGKVTWKFGTASKVEGVVVVLKGVQFVLDEKGHPSFFTNLLCLFPEGSLNPLFLATSLDIQDISTAKELLHLYELRWKIETFHWYFKERLQAKRFLVRSWTAIQRLLTFALLAGSLLSFFLSQKTLNWGRRLFKSVQRLISIFSLKPSKKVAWGRGHFLECFSIDFFNHTDDWRAILSP